MAENINFKEYCRQKCKYNQRRVHSNIDINLIVTKGAPNKMSKLNSPSSNNSATSSETSETQSVEENPQGGTQPPFKATKNWKKVKEGSEKEDKKPPWRTVSVSTLPKPDTNALLKAKLLDASRRLRAGKANVAVQTDMPLTKLMKEVNLDVQSDLVTFADKAILTDGAVTLKHDHPGEFLLTHSAAQMTESIIAVDKITQTATPRAANPIVGVKSMKIDLFSETEKLLLKQMQEIKEINEKLGWKTEYVEQDDDQFSEDSLSIPLTKRSTSSSWIFDEDLPPPMYSTQLGHPWSSFNQIASRSNMKLLPLSARPNRKEKLLTSPVAWTEEHVSVVFLLLQETHRMARDLEAIATSLVSKVQFEDIPREDKDLHLTFLSDYWEPILKKTDKLLEQKFKDLKHPPRKVFEKAKPVELI